MLHIALPHETVYNPAGRVTTIHHHSAAEYDPFGEPIIAPIGTAYGFTGELTDGSGLVYLRDPRTWNGCAWVEGNVIARIAMSRLAIASSSVTSSM
ncbi:MAG: hypothetical protein J5J04_12135 [Anaerolineae bacterium]|jgi:hypothetical protein|nr:hypothetical protein [Chloroflexota bacterium]MCO6444820.1 hypothetical protein [Anaerolineae bacterium]MDL1916843.1 hypothetical protein [Anaerolineae bacterium CFX4]MEB2367126.1 hypothetical protein [Chloroflexota bacterium]